MGNLGKEGVGVPLTSSCADRLSNLKTHGTPCACRPIVFCLFIITDKVRSKGGGREKVSVL